MDQAKGLMSHQMGLQVSYCFYLEDPQEKVVC